MQWRLISDRNPDARIDPQDRGLHYGDGLFETLLQRNGQLLYWDAHYQRLSRDAARLGIPCPPETWLREALLRGQASDGDRVLKLILTRGKATRATFWPEQPQPAIYLFHYPYAPKKQELAATFSKHPLSWNPVLAGIKHLNRLDYILAARELAGQTDFEQLLLTDGQGRVIETLVHNLFWVRDGQVHTPDLSRCGVNGVMRKAVIKRLERDGKAVRIGDCSRDDLLTADELFVCNSVQGIRALTRIGELE